MKQNTDRISNLPPHITDQILLGLPFKHAVRTSVLSKNWRYKWAKLPHLVFDDQCVSITTNQDKAKFINFVDRVLLLHNGSLHKFKLSHAKFLGMSDIDQWILLLSRKYASVKEFILHVWDGGRYKVPSSLFSLENLIHLELYNCVLKPPSTFKGFKNLKSLDLRSITISQDVFEILITSSSMLERLTVGYIYGNVNVPYELPCLCTNLKYLSVRMNFNDLNESVVALSLLRSCPNLGELVIWTHNAKTSNDTPVDFRNIGGHWNSMIAKLRLLKIEEILGTTPELVFIKFLLLNSPMLKRMTVKPTSGAGGLELLKELVRFPRVSPTAEIIYLNP